VSVTDTDCVQYFLLVHSLFILLQCFVWAAGRAFSDFMDMLRRLINYRKIRNIIIIIIQPAAVPAQVISKNLFLEMAVAWSKVAFTLTRGRVSVTTNFSASKHCSSTYHSCPWRVHSVAIDVNCCH